MPLAYQRHSDAREEQIERLAHLLGVSRIGIDYLSQPCRLRRRKNKRTRFGQGWTCDTHSRVTYDPANCKDGKKFGVPSTGEVPCEDDE